MNVDQNWNEGYDLYHRIVDVVDKNIMAMVIEAHIFSADAFRETALEPFGDFDLRFFLDCLLKAIELFRDGSNVQVINRSVDWMIRSAEGNEILAGIGDPRAIGIARCFQSVAVAAQPGPAWKFDWGFAAALLKRGLDRPKALDLAFRGEFLTED